MDELRGLQDTTEMENFRKIKAQIPSVKAQLLLMRFIHGKEGITGLTEMGDYTGATSGDVLTIADIMRLLNCTKPTATKTVNELIDGGLVGYKRPDGGRAKQYMLTVDGAKAYAEYWKAREALITLENRRMEHKRERERERMRKKREAKKNENRKS